VRAGDRITWQGGVYALQEGLKLKIHIGGVTALEELGSAHFVPMARHRQLYLYVSTNTSHAICLSGL
jgi:hypothetical protein